MLKRIAIYLNEMFPITSFVGTMLTGFAIQLTYLRLFSLPAQFHYQMLLSGIVITSVTLLIRIMDEFKDFEDDKRNFPLRPLPSGKVLPSDLKVLAAVCVSLILLLSLTSLPLFVFSLATLGFTVLMLKWFFVEDKMRKSLPLAFATHHPIVIFNIIYLLLGMIQTFPELDWSKAFLILPIALIFTNWEIARKIRMPEQETEYTTYSKIWGPRTAAMISFLLQLIYTATVYLVFYNLGTPNFLRIVFLILMFVMMIPTIRFMINLKLKAPLKTNAESQILLIIGFLIAACFL
jgi:4-hydroxybenzoate polyprenyltransferase